MGSVAYNLFDSNMDRYTRAGLAALYMSLKAAEKMRPPELSPVSWKMTKEFVSLKWECTDQEFMDVLMRWCWQVDDGGMLYFPAIHFPWLMKDVQHSVSKDSQYERHCMHDGIVYTFLQHGKVRKSEKNRKEQQHVLDGESNEFIRYRYKPFKKHSGALPCWRSAKDFCNSKKIFKDKVPMKGWAMPGAAARYPSDTKGSVSWEEAFRCSPLTSILYLLAPIVCFYHRKAQSYFFIIPDIYNLVTFSKRRFHTKLNPDIFDMTTTGDAGLHTLTCLVRKGVGGCQVVQIGPAYIPNQRSRKKVVTIPELTEEKIHRYRLILKALPNPLVKGKNGSFYGVDSEKCPTLRGLFADNLVQGFKWYKGLSGSNVFYSILKDGKKAFFLGKSLTMLRESNKMFDEEIEMQFMEAVQHALRIKFAKEYEAANRFSGSPSSRSASSRIDDLRSKIIRDINGSRTPAEFRSFLAKFFADGSKLTNKEMLKVFEDIKTNKWSEWKDLMLLAIATYKSNKEKTNE